MDTKTFNELRSILNVDPSWHRVTLGVPCLWPAFSSWIPFLNLLNPTYSWWPSSIAITSMWFSTPTPLITLPTNTHTHTLSPFVFNVLCTQHSWLSLHLTVTRGCGQIWNTRPAAWEQREASVFHIFMSALWRHCAQQGFVLGCYFERSIHECF